MAEHEIQRIEQGRALVRITKDLPADWVPVLTSGCGSGTGLKINKFSEEIKCQPCSYDNDLLSRLVWQMERGCSMKVFSHPQLLRPQAKSTFIPGVAGVILAGGESRRMGSDKALLPIEGARFIDHIYRRTASMFEEVIIVTNSPQLYSDLPCRKVPDLYQGQGALAGIHAGLKAASSEQVFVVGCDMPFVVPELVREICARGGNVDLVLPHSNSGHEPLHALYGKGCLPAMEELLDSGLRRIILFFDKVRLLKLDFAEIARLDPQGMSFRNINTPEDYYRLRGRLPVDVGPGS